MTMATEAQAPADGDNHHHPPSSSSSSPSAQEQQQQQQPPPPPPPPPPQPQQQQGETRTTTPASPPLPARHTATTPGPRAQRLQESFDAALARTLARISPDNFSSCYPTLAARAPHVLRQVQRGMVDRLGQLCAAEFAKVLDRYAVVPRLNELEALAGDAELRRRAAAGGGGAARARGKGKGREGGGEKEEEEEDGAAGRGQDAGEREKRPVPPHLLPAGAVLAAHLAPHLASQQSQLNARLQNTQAANAVLWGEVQAQRAEVESLLASLEAALADVDGAAGLMEGVPAEALAVESRALEVEMTDA